MPTIGRTKGIVIRMYYDEHDPPHLHAFGNDFTAKVALGDGSVMESIGRLRPTDARALRNWTLQHQVALFANWVRGRNLEPLIQIEG